MYYVRTNGSEYVVVNHENRYLVLLTEDRLIFPNLNKLEREEWEEEAMKFMKTIKEEKSLDWFDIDELDNLLGYDLPYNERHDIKVIAEIDCDWL